MIPDPPRIASLLPATTEIVCELGLRDALVLRSHECDRPAGVRRVSSATAPKYDPDGTSYQIDERLRALLQEGLGVFRIDADALRRERPDVILTQDQCEVCAVPFDEVRRAAEELLDPPPRIVSVSPTTLKGILASIRTIADAVGVPERGRERADALGRELKELTERARSLVAGQRPRVLAIEWYRPLMAAGNWVPELVERAGGRNLAGEPGRHSPFVEWESLVRTDPDVVVLMPCGFGLERARHEAAQLQELDGWDGLPAVREGRVAVVDGNRYFNRPGPGIVDSLRILIEVLHPDRVPPRFLGTGWAWLSPRP